MNIRNVINRFLICAILLLTALPIFAVEVGDYPALITAIEHNEDIIQITNDFDFGNTPLTISTNTVFTTVDGSTYTIKGNGTTSPMITFKGAESTISNINFSSSTAENPAINLNIAASAERDYSTFTINNVEFSHNTSSTNTGGGALIINSAQGTLISNTTFSTNSATGTGANGGALYYQGEKGFIGRNINAYENTAAQDGGAIYASTATLIGSIFSTNTAVAGNGGAIHVSSGTVSDSAFLYNIAQQHGGAIYASTLTLAGSTFSTNTATTGNGGALYISSGTVSNSAFSYNIAQQDGGAIYASTLTLAGSTFSTNTATAGNGGAIYVSSGTISNSTFSYNTAQQNGGAIYASTLTLSGTTFSTNTAAVSGGAIYVTDSATIQNTSFLYNKATSTGGAIYNTGDTSISRSTFENNTSSKGGAIYNSGTLKIVTGTFKNNQAYSGGAIYNDGTLNLLSTNFSQNNATSGGAIYLDGGTLNINNSSNFINNNATDKGGAIYVASSSVISLKPNGGAITFRSNTDSSGSNDIYLDGSSTLTISGGGTVNFYGGVKGSGSSMDATDTTINWYAENGYDGNFTVTNGALNIFSPSVGPFNNISLTDSSLSLQNGIINTLNLSDLNITGDIPLYLDIDPAHSDVDHISAVSGSGTFNINNYNQLRILTDNSSLATVTVTPGATINVNENEDFYGPLYIYRLQAVPGEPDQFSIMHTSRLNPMVSALPVAANSKVVANLNTVNSLYNRIDVMLSREYLEYNYQRGLRDNPYIQMLEDEIASIDEQYSKDQWKKMVWFIPNAGYQKVDYGNDVDNVKNIFYGGLAGVDYPFWLSENSALIPTIFMGYLGANQKYRETTLHSDSFALGGMLTYMKNFAIISGQAYVTNGPEYYHFKTYKGSFDIFTFTASIKGELNVNLTDSFVMQPALTAFYNLSNLQNYITATSARMNSTRFHNFLLIPSVKFMTSYNNWYPYLGISYNSNNGQMGKIVANEITLPKYRLKNSAEISAGVENTFFKNYSGYAQLSTYLGSTKGVSFQMGIRGYLE